MWLKMKVVLTALNAKFIHSNLAIYSLKSYAKQRLDKLKEDVEIFLAEYTINQPFDQILQNLYEMQPDFLGFSCYLWNISMVKNLVREYRKLDSKVKIWLGGPEVSFDPLDCLYELPQLDGIMIGEGEETFSQLLEYYHSDNTEKSLSEIEGIAFWTRTDKKEAMPILTRPREVLSFQELPFPYSTEKKTGLSHLEHRIIYYESGRGCPFSCSYCLSSVDKTVRFRDWERVKEELQFFLDEKVPQVKFVDRTFNCNKEHTMRIWRFIKEKDNGITNFHFEIAGDILDEEEIELLNSMRAGLVQLEIGVQSFNPKTLAAIGRKMNLERIKEVTKKLHEGRKVHQHLDLIAGIPYEDLFSFRQSFNGVYAMKPDQLQLGFLKVLKGSPLQKRIEEYGIVAQSCSPYEVLYTKWLSYKDIIQLKRIEEMVEVYYNSSQFMTTMKYLLHFFCDAYTMYEMIAKFYEKQRLEGQKQSRIKQYEILFEFISQWTQQKKETEFNLEVFREILFYDFCLRESPKSRPIFAPSLEPNRDIIRKAAEAQRKKKEIVGAFHIEHFCYNPEESAVFAKPIIKEQLLLFEYQTRDPISHNAKVKVIKSGCEEILFVVQ